MKKVFIALETQGRSIKDIKKDIKSATKLLRLYFGETIAALYYSDSKKQKDSNKLDYLAESIKLLGECDYAYFIPSYELDKQCRIQRRVCESYGIEIISTSDICRKILQK